MFSFTRFIVLLCLLSIVAAVHSKESSTPNPLSLALSLESVAKSEETPLAVVSALNQILPTMDGVKVRVAPLPEFYEATLGSDIIYVSEDDLYVIQGKVVNLKTRVDLVEESLSSQRKLLLGEWDKNWLISFVPESPIYSVYVFTDVDCTYCRRLHAQITEYNDLGIAIHYLLYPRGGLNTPSFDKAVAVWCAEDRVAAFTSAQQGVMPPALECGSPVQDQFNLGNQAGVAKMGTPTIVLEDGSVVRGYVPPADLYAHLRRRFSTPDGAR